MFYKVIRKTSLRCLILGHF